MFLDAHIVYYIVLHHADNLQTFVLQHRKFIGNHFPGGLSQALDDEMLSNANADIFISNYLVRSHWDFSSAPSM
jgi:hypothetical protein